MTAEKKTTKTKAAHERVYICVRQKPGGRAKQSEAGVARFVSCVLGSLAMFWGMPSIKENLTWIACFVLGVILSENTRSGVLVTVFMPVLPLPVLVLLVLISKGGTLEVDIALCFFPPFFFLVCCLPQQIHTHTRTLHKKNSCVSHSSPVFIPLSSYFSSSSSSSSSCWLLLARLVCDVGFVEIAFLGLVSV